MDMSYIQNQEETVEFTAENDEKEEPLLAMLTFDAAKRTDSMEEQYSLVQDEVSLAHSNVVPYNEPAVAVVETPSPFLPQSDPQDDHSKPQPQTFSPLRNVPSLVSEMSCSNFSYNDVAGSNWEDFDPDAEYASVAEQAKRLFVEQQLQDYSSPPCSPQGSPELSLQSQRPTYLSSSYLMKGSGYIPQRRASMVDDASDVSSVTYMSNAQLERSLEKAIPEVSAVVVYIDSLSFFFVLYTDINQIPAFTLLQNSSVFVFLPFPMSKKPPKLPTRFAKCATSSPSNTIIFLPERMIISVWTCSPSTLSTVAASNPSASSCY